MRHFLISNPHQRVEEAEEGAGQDTNEEVEYSIEYLPTQSRFFCELQFLKKGMKLQ
jgi:hypothetical protein